LLAVLFLFAGGVKLALPLEMLSGPITLPGWFLHFIGITEVLGAIGLIAPSVARIRPGLTPLAASGLGVIMVGATAITFAAGGGAQALVPAIVGALAVFIAVGRSHLAPIGPRTRSRGMIAASSTGVSEDTDSRVSIAPAVVRRAGSAIA
jgi:hypothetical protein